MPQKIMPFLWFDGEAEQATHFYVSLLPDSHVDHVARAPADFPSGKAGAVLVVEFTLAGQRYGAMNGGPAFKPNESVSFQVATDDQAETDRLWDAIVGNGGAESACGWCKDRWGFSWQITPRRLSELMREGGARGRAAFEAMMTMRRIDIAALEAAADAA